MAMDTAKLAAVKAWLEQEFPGLTVEQEVDVMNVVKFKVGDGRRARYWLEVTAEFFSTYETADSIKRQLDERQVGRVLREHEGQAMLLPREGSLQPRAPQT